MRISIRIPGSEPREETATVVRDQERKMLMLVGEKAVPPGEFLLRHYELLSATDKERSLLREAGYRIKGL
ncbi:MAG TPA: hypothetical protein VEI94_03600 [Candidatus Bathyarchaeia archaeon]|nr:hypothetical protein [Candidatus Bathyarchaeia archaeon]